MRLESEALPSIQKNPALSSGGSGVSNGEGIGELSSKPRPELHSGLS